MHSDLNTHRFGKSYNPSNSKLTDQSFMFLLNLCRTTKVTSFVKKMLTGHTNGA
jgi:hypothetical protein